MRLLLCFVLGVAAAGSSASMGKVVPRAEVEAEIAEAGRTHPAWWESVSLDYPKSLRLDWPEPREERRWEPTRNPGQYLIGIVYLRPEKWKPTAKLFHHMLAVNRERPDVRASTMDRLGHIYTSLLGDYARGAFWYRSAAAEGLTSTDQKVELARCYWQLGNGEMAAELLAGLQSPTSSAILVWAGMGQLGRALEVADSIAAGRQASKANLAAGAACSSQADYEGAARYFTKVVNQQASRGNRRRASRYQQCAREAISSLDVMKRFDPARLKSGTYTGVATGFRGDVKVSVTVEDGKIGAIEVVEHEEDWFFTSLKDVPQQIVDQQGLEGVDAITGATMTSVAIVNAAAKALD
jgi:uncharacterized protein with FMN-binding domain